MYNDNDNRSIVRTITPYFWKTTVEGLLGSLMDVNTRKQNYFMSMMIGWIIIVVKVRSVTGFTKYIKLN